MITNPGISRQTAAWKQITARRMLNWPLLLKNGALHADFSMERAFGSISSGLREQFDMEHNNNISEASLGGHVTKQFHRPRLKTKEVDQITAPEKRREIASGPGLLKTRM